jgi:hypothetical protein
MLDRRQDLIRFHVREKTGPVGAKFQDGKETDRVKSYAAMRKISTRKDKSGFVRLQLNNKDIFHLGPLDQGWWPDGLYTPPSDDAMRYDLVKTKEWGFNMVRKHMNRGQGAIGHCRCACGAQADGGRVGHPNRHGPHRVHRGRSR